jgi:uncharacterized membrane protein
MSKTKHIKWLYKELPHLVGSGIIPAESKEKLHSYYGTPRELNKQNVALVIFSVLGAVLIGSGTILVLAHNWDNLSRALRTCIAFAPLVAGQVLGVWVLLRKGESTAWRESVSVFIMLALGAVIALVSQIYHLGGDLDTFLLVWMLLSLPLVYIFSASLPAILYMGGIAWWALYYRIEQGGSLAWYWPVIALVLPHILLVCRHDRYSVRAVFLQWALCLTVGLIPFGMCEDQVIEGWPFVVFAGLFGVICLGGTFWKKDDVSLMRKPFEVIGCIGIIILAYILTFSDVWDEITPAYGYSAPDLRAVLISHDFLLGILLIISVLILLAIMVREKKLHRIELGIFPLLVFICFWLHAGGNWMNTADSSVLLCVVLFNIYLLAYGIYRIVQGIRVDSLFTVNTGMLLLALIIFTRFFDVDIGFLPKGIVFIMIGIGFLVTNIFLVNRRTRERVS